MVRVGSDINQGGLRIRIKPMRIDHHIEKPASRTEFDATGASC